VRKTDIASRTLEHEETARASEVAESTEAIEGLVVTGMRSR
jgi:hypothetical protein